MHQDTNRELYKARLSSEMDADSCAEDSERAQKPFDLPIRLVAPESTK